MTHSRLFGQLPGLSGPALDLSWYIDEWKKESVISPCRKDLEAGKVLGALLEGRRGVELLARLHVTYQARDYVGMQIL